MEKEEMKNLPNGRQACLPERLACLHNGEVGLPAGEVDRRYTYADYLTWQMDEMVELIKGKIFKSFNPFYA